MTYDPKFDSLYLVTGDAYNSSVSISNAAVNYYFLRQSQRDLVGGYIYLIDDPYRHVGLQLAEKGSSVTFGVETNGAGQKTILDVINTYDMLDEDSAVATPSGHTVNGYWGDTSTNYFYHQYTTGLHFKSDGKVDFANATGNVGMGEDVKLQYSILNVTNIGNIYAVDTINDSNVVCPIYTSSVDVTTLYSETTLTIEGSLYSIINTSAITERESVPYYKKNYANVVIDRRRLVASGLRAENISLELNMAGQVNVTMANQMYLDYVKTTFEYVTFQAAGFLADGVSGDEYGKSEANGTLSLGNTVGGANSMWTGDVNVEISDITLGTQIYKARVDCEYDAAGNPFRKNGKVNYQTYVERDKNSLGNVAGSDPETANPIEEPWEWEVKSGDNTTVGIFVDPDFHEDSTNTQITNNTVVANGLYGNTVELGNMTVNGSINTAVKDVVLYGEFAFGSGNLGFNETYDTAGLPTNDTARHLLRYTSHDRYYSYTPDAKEFSYMYEGNTASTAAIQAGTLKVNGDFSGVISADFTGVKAVTTATEFHYEYRKWLYDVYEYSTTGGTAVTAKNFTSDVKNNPGAYYNDDLKMFIDPKSRYQIDLRYDAHGNIIGTGYLLSPSGNGTYEDPATGGYIDSKTGLVYKDSGLTTQLYNGTMISRAGDYVYQADYDNYISSVRGIAGGSRSVYYWLYEKKDTSGNNALNIDSFRITGDSKNVSFYDRVVDRTITQESTSLDTINGTKHAYAFVGSVIGIDASTITVNGQFDNKIEVHVSDSILKNLTAIGINASTLTASNGLFAPEVHVTVNNDVLVREDKDDPDNKSNAIHALKLGTLTAEALAGTYYVYGGNIKTAAFSIDKFDSAFDNDANPSTFNIIADVYSQHAIFANLSTSWDPGWDLRISGNLYAGKTINQQGNWITENDQFVYTGSGKDYNEIFELAAGADTFGNWHFGLGFDTLTIDSNAHMEGNIYVGNLGQMGTFNLIFNLNDQVLKESDRNTGRPVLEGKFMTEDGFGIASPTMIAISLNDVVLQKDANGDIISNSYTILGDQKQTFVDRMETVQLKYDGLSLMTCDLEGVDLVAEIGYYDGNGIWIRTTVGDGTGFEFRQNNFTATIGIYNGVKNPGGMILGNVIRVYDRNNNDVVIFEAHSEYDYNALSDAGSVKIVVDVLPDMVELPDGSGNTYYTTVIETGIENLREWYNVEDRTLTVVFDDHSVDIANMSYQFEYYIQTLNENGNVIEETNTVVREIHKSTDLNPRTSVVLDGIAANQKVVWRVRQVLGSGIENSGEWRSIDDYEFTSPEDLSQVETETGYTLEWKNGLTAAQTPSYAYKVTYTLVDKNGKETVNTINVAATDARKIYCSIDTKGQQLRGWNVAIIDTSLTVKSETAEYQNLQMERVVLTAPDAASLKVYQDENSDVVFSWDNSCKSTDVCYKLEYRVGNQTNNYNGGWKTVYVKANQAVDENVTYTAALTLPNSAEALEWRVTAYQQNGEEVRISTSANAETVVQAANDGSHLLVTTPQDATGTKNDVTFTWSYDNDIDQAFLLEYTQGGEVKTVLLSREEISEIAAVRYYNESGAVDYVYVYDKVNKTERWEFQQNGQTLTDTRNISYSCEGDGWALTFDAVSGKVHYKVAHSAATGDIQWRVRERDVNGELTADNKWYIFETEALDNFNCRYQGVTDPFTGEKSRTATISFESNVIGSSYRLEYMIISNGATTTYESPIVVTYNDSTTKYFEHEIKDLAADGSQSVAWRVSVKEAGAASWSDWQYPQSNMEDLFDGTFLLDSPTKAENLVNQDVNQTEGKSAVASLTWQAGENITNGLNRYVVEYFQTTEALTAEQITDRFESNTAWDGSILNSKYARMEVTNNELTLTGLRDTQYVYWRVRAIDNKENVSEWTVGDPVHIYLQDKYAPAFSETPVASQKWAAHDTTNENRDPSLRDIYLTWKAASDDKVGVKRYEFTLTGGSAEDLQFAEYYYSLDGGKTWSELDYSDGVAYIEHMDKVTSYQVKVTNVGNTNYGWKLTAKDFQNNATTINSSNAWFSDTTAPQFAQQNDDFLDWHEGYSDIAVSMGGTVLSTGEFSMTPTFIWSPAGDDLKFNQDYSDFIYDENGSGIAYYMVEWSMHGATFSMKVDVDDLTLNSEGKYTWTLNPYELHAQNYKAVNSITGNPLVIPNQEFAWKFYAVDNVGNKSAALQPQDKDGNWKPDSLAPVFESNIGEEISWVRISEFGNNRSVTVSWKEATDYWHDLSNDPGAGVAYYTFTYWTAGGEPVSVRVDANDIANYTMNEKGEKIYSAKCFVPNYDYDFTITATDICGNTSSVDDGISGFWSTNDDPIIHPSYVESQSSVTYENGIMKGNVSWSVSQEYAGGEALYYALACDGKEGSGMQGRILSDFTGDTSMYSSVASFTQVGEDRWTVIFKDDTSQRYTLKYDAANNSYTMSRTVTIDGKSYELLLSNVQGNYSASYQLGHDDYSWQLSVKAKDAVPEIIGSDLWNGDTTAPIFTSSAILGVIDYVKKTVNGETVRTAEITITISNDLVSDGDGSGVAYYLVEWGADGSGLFDNSFKISSADPDGDGKVFYTFAIPDEKYQYRVIAYDWAGNASDPVMGDLLVGDIRGPRLEAPVCPAPQIQSGSNNMKASLSWMVAEDDKHVAGDNIGVGVKEYILTITDETGSYEYVVKGDDFEEPDLQSDGFVGYQKRTFTENGVLLTAYCKTYKFSSNPALRGELTYVLAHKDQNGNDVAGEYRFKFSNLEASDYTWSLVAVDYEGNKSGAQSDKFVGDNNIPVLSVSGLPTSYTGSGMTVSIAVSGTDIGTGIEQYSFTYGDEGSFVIEENENGDQTEVFVPGNIPNKTFTFSADYMNVSNGYTTKDNKTYTLNVENGTVVYNVDTGKYTITLNLSNADYQWSVSAQDYAGNKSNEIKGEWNQDVAAPVFKEYVTDDLNISINNTGKLYASVEWYYKPGDANNTVIDPAGKDSKEDVGCGIASFTFNWRKAETSAWSTITIEAGAAKTVTKNGFTFTYDSVSGKYQVYSDSLANGRYEWFVSATDHFGHEMEEPVTTTTTGTGDSAVTTETFDPDTKYSGIWDGAQTPEFTGEYTDVEYFYRPGYENDITFTWSSAQDAFNGASELEYSLSYGYYETTTIKGEDNKETTVTTYVPVDTIVIDSWDLVVKADGKLSFTVKDRIFNDGTYAWQITATDELGNVGTLEADEKFTVDRTAPEGDFENLTYGPSITVDWFVHEEYEHPLYVYTYTVKDISVEFNLANTFAEETGITYEIRTYGRGANNQEPVRMQTFTTTSSSFVLDDTPGKGVGYITNLYNNRVYWDVRAIDSHGNATDWFAGASFELVDPLFNDEDHNIYDKSAAPAPDGLSATDSVEDGLLTLNWGVVYDIFGVDRYELAVYDAAGSALVKTFTVDAKDFLGSFNLTQNDLNNGSYQFAVRSIDCAGNVSAYSSKLAFTYDIVRPDFDIDSVSCSVSHDSASFSWDPMTDNLAAGKYVVVIKRGSIIEVNQEVTGTSFVWDNIPNFGTYTYSITALDAEGNASAAVKNGNFVIENAIESTYKWGDTSVSNMVGNGYASDTWRIVLDGTSDDKEYAAAKVTIKLQVVDAESGVDVVIRDHQGICIDTISINDCSQWTGVYYWNEDKSLYNSYTMEIIAHDDSVNTPYILSVTKEDYTKSNILDDSYEQARDNADYRIVIGGTSGTIVEDEWLGFSDDRDFRQITVNQDGTYSFDISDSTLSATLWQEVKFTNELTALAQGSQSLKDITLLQGMTYYLEIEKADTSYDVSYDVQVTNTGIAAASLEMNSSENKNNFFAIA